jgi:aminoglycoside phosphotransferase (APT) family kinase protein
VSDGSIPDDGPKFATPHGFGNDDRSLFLRKRPPDQALRWVERQLGARVVGVRVCKGGSSSAIHVVRVARPPSTATVVLRRYVIAELNEEEPDIVDREARVLELLERCEVPTPRLLGADPTGVNAGVPAVLMSLVPGRLDWSPTDLELWLHRLAEALGAIHHAGIGVADGVQPFQPYPPESWDPPDWMRDERLWERALDIFHGPRLDPDEMFIHRDYHPGNVLWRKGRVSGVVDWQSASIGPRAVDVFHCRANLLGRFGIEVADRFISVWEATTGLTYHPWAETVMLVDVLDWITRHNGPSRERVELESLLARRLAELGR